MADEQKEIPTVVLKDTLQLMGDGKKFTLKSAKALKEGESKWGPWYLWKVEVKDATVSWGRKPDVRIEKGYSGEAFFFPTVESMHKELLAFTGGTRENVEIMIKKTAEETPKGLKTRYPMEKLSDGMPSSSPATLTSTETLLLNDTRDIINETGKEITEDEFVDVSQEDDYGGQISKARAKELYKLL